MISSDKINQKFYGISYSETGLISSIPFGKKQHPINIPISLMFGSHTNQDIYILKSPNKKIISIKLTDAWRSILNKLHLDFDFHKNHIDARSLLDQVFTHSLSPNKIEKVITLLKSAQAGLLGIRPPGADLRLSGSPLQLPFTLSITGDRDGNRVTLIREEIPMKKLSDMEFLGDSISIPSKFFLDEELAKCGQNIALDRVKERFKEEKFKKGAMYIQSVFICNQNMGYIAFYPRDGKIDALFIPNGAPKGEGGHKSAYKAISLFNQKKYIFLEAHNNQESILNFIYEASFLKICEKGLSPNTVHPYTYSTADIVGAAAISERMHTDLFNYINDEKNISFSNKLQIALSLVQKAKELSNAGIVHRDIKVENILIQKSKNGRETPLLRFCDLAFADISGVDTDIRGTFRFMAPEIIVTLLRGIHHYPMNTKEDVWSLGCALFALIYEMEYAALDEPPKTEKEYKKSFEIGKQELKKSPLNFLMRMLEEDPEDRASFEEVERMIEEEIKKLPIIHAA
ncbi:MAG: protein kinase [Chlamydia sp.]